MVKEDTILTVGLLAIGGYAAYRLLQPTTQFIEDTGGSLSGAVGGLSSGIGAIPSLIGEGIGGYSDYLSAYTSGLTQQQQQQNLKNFAASQASLPTETAIQANTNINTAQEQAARTALRQNVYTQATATGANVLKTATSTIGGVSKFISGGGVTGIVLRQTPNIIPTARNVVETITNQTNKVLSDAKNTIKSKLEIEKNLLSRVLRR